MHPDGDRMVKVISFLLAFALYACGPANTPDTKSASGGTSSCSATSDAGKSCKVSCVSPQAASCTRGTGSAEPSCVCK
jgi:hypothetical protein